MAIFASFQVISLTRAAFALLLGDWVTGLAGYLSAGSVIVLLLSTLWFVRRFGFPLVGFASTWYISVACLVAFNVLRGFVQGLDGKYVAYDAMSYMVILCFVVLGAIPEAFSTIRRNFFWVLLVAIPLNLIAMGDLGQMTYELSAGDRMARETLSYRTQNALDVVILCAFFAFEIVMWKRLVVAAGFSLVLLQQVIYQKRLETAFYLLAMMAIGVVWLRTQGAMRRQLRRIFLGATCLIFAVIFCVTVVKKDYIVPQAMSLLNRLTGQSIGVEEKGGLLLYTFIENERFTMVRDSLATLGPWEIVFGRGMGGGVELSEINSRVLESSQREAYWNSYYLEDYGFFGRRGFEMGMATPILKGGIIFFLLYYSGFAYAIMHTARITRVFFGRIAVAVVALYWLYTGYGGDFALSMTFQMATVSSCLGCCLAIASNAANPSRVRYPTLRNMSHQKGRTEIRD